jgi:iron complex transport system substrate-binding protein
MKHHRLSTLLSLSLLLFLWTTASHPNPSRFVDEVGREVNLPPFINRIISLAPSITEILFSLGLDQEIVGVSTQCNYPEKAKDRARVGSYISLDFERILSLKPDLIIATGAGNTQEMVERLEKLGIPTFVIFPKDFDGILRSITDLGHLLNREKEAQQITQGIRMRRQRVVALTQGLYRPRVFLQIGEAPLVTVGKGSFADDLIFLAGGRNITEETKMYPRLGMEEILKRSPEVIIVSSMNPKGDYEKTLQEWTRWKTLPAVQQGRIHLVDSDLIDRPSPRIIEGLKK